MAQVLVSFGVSAGTAALVQTGVQVAVALAAVAVSIAQAVKGGRTAAAGDGPRLGDTTVTVSTYGNPIPTFGAGRYRVGTNMVWSTDIVETAKKRSAGGKGGLFGGGGGSFKTYSYTINAAFAFAEGPIGGVRRIWADSKLIYDATGASDVFYKYGTESAIRIYLGTEDQEPDPLIEAVEGSGNVPAHRGMAYFVLEGYPLADHGNRIPQFQVEPVFGSSTVDPEAAVPDSDEANGFSQGTRIRNLQMLYYIIGTQNGVRRLSLTGAEIEQKLEVTGGNVVFDAAPPVGIGNGGLQPESIHAGQDGKVFLFGSTRTGPQDFYLARINPFTLDLLEAGPALQRSGLDPVTLRPNTSATWVQDSVAGIKNYTLVHFDGTDGGSSFGDSHIALWDRSRHEVADLYSFFRPTGSRVSLCHMAVDGDGFVWAIGIDTDKDPDSQGRLARLYRIEASVRISTLPIVYGSTVIPIPIESVLLKVKDYDLTQYGVHFEQATATSNPGGLVAYDAVSNGLVILGTTNPTDNKARWIRWDIGRKAVALDEDNNPVSRELDGTADAAILPTLTKFDGNRSSWAQGTFGGEVHLNVDSDTAIKIRASDLQDFPITSPATTFAKSGFWFDGDTSSAYYFPEPTGGMDEAVRVFFGGINSPPPNVKDVLEDYLERKVLLDPSDFAVDAGLSSELVDGFLVARQMQARAGIDPLTFAYNFDLVESDGKIKAVKRGGSSARTIQEDDLAARTGEPGDRQVLLAEDRGQEIELPRRVDVRYFDPSRDDQEGNQHATRYKDPVATQFSDNVSQVDLPLLLGADKAKAAAEINLFQAWVARNLYTFAAGPKHMDLEPSDVVDVVRGGITFPMRLTQVGIGEGFMGNFSGEGSDSQIFTSASPGVDGGNVPSQVLGFPGPTELFLLDIPLLRDQDDLGQSAAWLYVAFGAYREAWRAAVAQKSDDGGGSYESIAVAKGRSPWGYLAEQLAAVPAVAVGPVEGYYDQSLTTWDRNLTITVYVVDGADELESVTESELLTDPVNAMVILSEDGTGEVVQYANVTDNGDGTVTLDTLLRGRRGTEYKAVAGHLPGARVVFLEDGLVGQKSFALSEVGDTDLYRAPTLGVLLENTNVQEHTLLATGLKPLSGTQPVPDAYATGATRDPVTITWKRRTRNGGELDWENGQDQGVPTGEADEEYEVDLLNPAGTAVQLTKSGLSSPSASFTDAEQVAAGYSSGDPLNVVVYQVSQAVGRGIGRPATI